MKTVRWKYYTPTVLHLWKREWWRSYDFNCENKIWHLVSFISGATILRR